MKIKSFAVSHNNIPNKCSHEWRVYGTRLEEEVWTPIGSKSNCGWVICDKCGWEPYVEEYKKIGKREYYPFGKQNKKEGDISWYDYMVEIIKWGNEKEPTTPVVNTFVYAEFSWWEKLKMNLPLWILQIKNRVLKSL